MCIVFYYLDMHIYFLQYDILSPYYKIYCIIQTLYYLFIQYIPSKAMYMSDNMFTYMYSHHIYIYHVILFMLVVDIYIPCYIIHIGCIYLYTMLYYSYQLYISIYHVILFILVLYMIRVRLICGQQVGHVCTTQIIKFKDSIFSLLSIKLVHGSCCSG